MSFLRRDFAVPERAEGPGFHLRSITVHDLARDYDAVMSSRSHLWARFGELWGWPAADLSITQDLVDLGWHQKEFQLRRSFNDAVMAPDESRLLGCVYVDPPDEVPGEGGVDAEVWYWGRQDMLASGLEQRLDVFVRQWLAAAWPFAAVLLNGQPHHVAPRPPTA
jgi:hypothetical protein